MSNVAGQIELLLDINTVLNKVLLNKAELERKIRQSMDNVGDVSVSPNIVADAKKLKVEGDKIKAAIEKELGKAVGSAQISLNIADNLKKELKKVDSTLVREGSITKAALRKFLTDALTAAGLPTTLGKKSLLTPLLQLGGKDVASAKTVLADYIKSVKTHAKELTSSGEQVSNSLAAQQSKLSALTKANTEGLRDQFTRVMRDIKALAEAQTLVNPQSGSASSLTLPTDKNAESYDRLVKTLTAGREALYRLAAASQNSETLAESLGVSVEHLAAKIVSVTQSIDQEIATLRRLKTETGFVEQQEKSLQTALLQRNEIRKQLGATEDKQSKGYLGQLQKLYAAQVKLDAAQGSFKESDKIQKKIAAHKQVTTEILNHQKAVRELAKLEAAQTSAQPRGLSDYLQAQKKLRDFLVSNQALLGKNAQAVIVQQNKEILNTKVALAAQTRLRDAEQALKQAIESRGKTEDTAGGVYLKHLRDQYAAQLKLDALAGKGFKQSEELLKQIKAHAEITKLVSKQEDSKLRLAALDERLGRISKDNLSGQLDGQQKLLRLLTYQQESLKLNNETRLHATKLEIDALKQRLAEQNKLNEAVRLAADAAKIKAAYKGDRREVELRLLDAQIAKEMQLASLGSKDFSKVDTLSAKREEFVKTTKELEKQQVALERLTATFQEYRSSSVGLKGRDVTGEQYERAAKAVRDLESAINAAKEANFQAGTQSHALANRIIEDYQREAHGAAEVLRVQQLLLKSNEALNRVESAQTPKNMSSALKDYLHIQQQIIDVLEASRHKHEKWASDILNGSKFIHEQGEQRLRDISREIVANGHLGVSYTSLASAFRSFIRYGLEFAAFYQAQQSITQLVKSVVDLEDSLKSVQAIARATDSEMEGVTASVKQVAIATEFSTNEIAGAAETLAQAGVEINKVGEALAATADFASATGSKLQIAADLITTVHDVFKGLSFEEIADQLTATINLSKLTGSGLSTILSRAIEVSDTFKVGFAQSQAAFAVLRNAGIKDSVISTGYRQALLELFSPDAKTLKYLEGRYAELGYNLSQETIAAMFQGFTKAEDPILAVISELEKLGFATSAAAESSRVFDVRAKNVIDVLIKQKDEYASLTTQIEAHGAASKGAQTQLEALGKSWDNLGSVITSVASNVFGPGLAHIENMVDKVSELIQKMGEGINTLQRLQGTSGGAVAAVTGTLAGLASLRGGGSALRSVLTGLGVGAGTQAVEVGAAEAGAKINDGIGSLFAKIAGTAALFFASKALLSKIDIGSAVGGLFGRIGKEVARLGHARAGYSETVLSAAGKESRKLDLGAETAKAVFISRWIDKVLAALRPLQESVLNSSVGKLVTSTPQGKGLAAAVGVAIAAFVASMTLFGKRTEEQLNALNNDVAKINEDLDKANKLSRGGEQDKKAFDDLSASLERFKSARQNFFDRSLLEPTKVSQEVSRVLDSFKGISTDLKGGQLLEQINKLKDSVEGFGEGFDLNQLIDLVNEQSRVIASAEGSRAAIYQRVIEAYESENKGEPETAGLLHAFASLNAEQKDYLSREITGLDQVEQFLAASEPFATRVDEGVLKQIKALQDAKLEKEKEAVALQVEKAKESGDFSEVYAKVLQASKEGNAELLEVFNAELRRINEESKNKIGDELIDLGHALVEFVADMGDYIRAHLPAFNLPSSPEEYLYKTLANTIDPLGVRQGVLDSLGLGKDRESLKAKLFKDEKTPGAIPNDLLELAGDQRDVALRNKLADARKITEEQDRKFNEDRDRFRQSLSPARAGELGLSESFLEDKTKTVASQLDGLSTAWKRVYEDAVESGKSTEEIVNYLHEQREHSGQLPGVLKDILDANEKRLDEERNNQQIAADIGIRVQNNSKLIAEEQDRLDNLRQVLTAKQAELDSLTAEADRTPEGYKRNLAEVSAEIAQTEVSSLSRAIQEGADRVVELQKTATNLGEQYNTALSHTVAGVKKQAQTQEQINADYDKIVDKSQGILESIARLEQDRVDALAAGNAAFIKGADIDAQIYRAKLEQLNQIRQFAREKLLDFPGAKDKIGPAADNFKSLSEFFSTESGRAFLKVNPTALDHVRRLQETNPQVVEAAKTFTTNRLEVSKQASAGSLQDQLRETDLAAQVAKRGTELDLSLAQNPAEYEKRVTEQLLEELEKRTDAQETYVKQVTEAYAEQRDLTVALMGETAEGVTAADRNMYGQRKQLLTDYLQFHRENLESLLQEEKKHADAVRALSQELLDSQRADEDFKRGLYRETLNDYQKRKFDQQSAELEAEDALELLRKGNYEEGRKRLDAAIAKQKEVVSETIALESSQRLEYGATGAAIDRLDQLTSKRNEAIQHQIDLHKEEQAAAASAAKAELDAIQQLTQQLKLLTDAIARLPAIDLQVTGHTELDSLKNSVYGIGEAAKQAKRDLLDLQSVGAGTPTSTPEAPIAAEPVGTLAAPFKTQDKLAKQVGSFLDEGTKPTLVEEAPPLAAPSTVSALEQATTRATPVVAQHTQEVVSAGKAYADLGSDVIRVTDAQGKQSFTSQDRLAEYDLEGAKIDNLSQEWLKDATSAKAAGDAADRVFQQAPATQEAARTFYEVKDAAGKVVSYTDTLDTSLQGAGFGFTELSRAALESKGSLDNVSRTVVTPSVDSTSVDVGLDAIKQNVEHLGTVQTYVPVGLEDTGVEEQAQQIVDAVDSTTQTAEPLRIEADGSDAVSAATDTVETIRDGLRAAEVPPVTLTANPEPALQSIDVVQQGLAGLQDKTITITTRRVEEGGGEAASNVPGDGGATGEFSQGGYVRGPGTETSDQIPVMLSDKEYVMPAHAVKRLGVPFLDGLRRGEPVKQLAAGGYVGSNSATRETSQNIQEYIKARSEGLLKKPKPYTGKTVEELLETKAKVLAWEAKVRPYGVYFGRPGASVKFFDTAIRKAAAAELQAKAQEQEPSETAQGATGAKVTVDLKDFTPKSEIFKQTVAEPGVSPASSDSGPTSVLLSLGGIRLDTAKLNLGPGMLDALKNIAAPSTPGLSVPEAAVEQLAPTSAGPANSSVVEIRIPSTGEVARIPTSKAGSQDLLTILSTLNKVSR